jgi:hypothetical protein
LRSIIGKAELMPLPEFSPVRLMTNRFREKEGVGEGAIGVILHVFDDGFIVEFSRPDGATIAWFGVKPEDIEPVPEVLVASSNRSTV